jgi:hypothetical protein
MLLWGSTNSEALYQYLFVPLMDYYKSFPIIIIIFVYSDWSGNIQQCLPSS